MAEQYTYAVTRIHVNEQKLLSRKDLDQLVSARDLQDVLRLLSDKGWGAIDGSADDLGAMLAAEMEKTWDLIAELIEDLTPFDVFRHARDYHNLKAAIKLVYSDASDDEGARYYMAHGSIDPAVIARAAKAHDFSSLPPAMAAVGHEAYLLLAHTGNGQACDMLIDKASLVAIDAAGRQSGSTLLGRYAQLTVDCANIKTAVRCARMGKPRGFIENAIAPAGTLDIPKLIEAAAEGFDAICAFLQAGDYAELVDALRQSMAAFECQCDNRLIRLIRPQRHNYFTIEPIAAFILGRENEIRMVRLIMSAKVNQLSEQMLRERLREMYV